MPVEIIGYTPAFRSHFVSLNRAWLEAYFYVEPHDIEAFEKLEELILNPGGEIFFCLVDGEVAGTVAMQKVDDTTFELAKLAVAETFQGRKLSHLLMDACIQFARKKNAAKIMLMSSTKLHTALNLYRKYHFTEVPLAENDYDRADIQMELIL